MSRRFACAAAVAVVAFAAAAAPVPRSKPQARDRVPNSNALLKKHRPEATLSCSTAWQGGWPAERAFDGNPDTSWFTAAGDNVSNGKAPWVAVTFPEDVAVSRVTVLGNREPQHPSGYGVLAGRLELLNKDGIVIIRADREGTGERFDCDFVLAEAFGGVRTVRFVVTKDESTKANAASHCAGLAEVQVE